MFGRIAIKIVTYCIVAVSVGGLISGCYSLYRKRTLKDALKSEGYMFLSHSDEGRDRKYWIKKTSKYNKKVAGQSKITEDKLKNICSSLLETFEFDENFDAKAEIAKSWCVKS